MRAMALVGFLLLFSTTQAIARTAELIDPPPVSLSAGTGKNALTAIRQAADFPDWKIESEEAGRVVATYTKSGDSAKIAVTYDNTSIRVTYVDSVGLDYQEKNGTREINPNYNRWAKEYLDRVRIYLANDDVADTDPKLDVPRKPRKYEDQTSVVVDGCVLRVESTKKYLVKKESEEVATTLRHVVPVYLSSKDAAPEKVLAPFICGVMNFDVKPVLMAEKILRDGDEPPKEMTGLVSLDSGLDGPGESEAYRQLLASVVSEPDKTYYSSGNGGLVGALVIAAKSSHEGADIKYPEKPLTPESAALLLKKLGTPKVWVVRFSGMDVSMGSGIAGNLLHLGSGGPMSSYNYDIALIDLRNATTIWKNSAHTVNTKAPIFRAANMTVIDGALAKAPLKDATPIVADAPLTR